MSSPTITSGSVTTYASTTTANFSITVSKAQAGRILVLCNLAKDDTTIVSTISALAFDSTGVNATLSGGEIVLQGVTNIAQEGIRSSQCGVYFIKNADLPSAAGSYTFAPTFDADVDRYLWVCFEILDCPAEAYDNIAQNLSLTDVAAATAFSTSITPTVDNCLIVDIWATSHSDTPTFTSTETQVGVATQLNGAGLVSQYTQGVAASKSMEQESSTLHQRRVWTLLSFAGTDVSKYKQKLSDKPDHVAELDPNHFLYNNIKFAMWPADGGGTAHADVRNGKLIRSIGTASGGNRGVDANGKFFAFNPASSTRSSAHEIALLKPPELLITQELTVLIGYKRTGDQDAGYGRIISRTNGATGDDWSITQQAVSGSSYLRCRIMGTSVTGTSSMVLGEYHDIALTFNNVRQKLIVDGVVEGNGARVVSLAADQNISIGVNPGSDDRNLYGDVYYVVILDRGLSDAEVRRFQENPKQILKSNVVYLPVTSPDTNILATTDVLTIATFAATVNAETSIAATTDALTLTENASTVSLGVVVSATTHALTLSESAASVNAETNVNTALDALTLTENQATVNAETNVNATTDALTLSESQATVNAETNVNTNVHALTLTENQASLATGTNISATTDALTLTENQATVNAETNVNGTTDALTIATFGATITLPSGGTNIVTNVHALTITENVATINAANNIQATTDALVITTNVVDISTGIAPTSEGMQYTISGKKLHYTFDDEKVQYTMKA